MQKFYNVLFSKPIFNIFVLTFIFNLLILFLKQISENDYTTALLRMFNTQTLFSFVINLVIFHILFFVFRGRFKFVSWLFLAVMFILTITQIFLFINFGGFVNLVVIDAVFHTNLNEIIEFADYFTQLRFILCVFLLFVFSLLIIKLNFGFRGGVQAFYKVFRVVYIVLLVVFLGSLANRILIKKYDYTNSKLKSNELINTAFIVKQYIKTGSLITKINLILQEYDISKNANSFISEANITKIKNVVLIIGESLNKNYMSLYGYYLKTSPNLERLKDNIIVFSDTISPATSTNPSLMRVLNFSNNDSKNAWFKSLNIVDMFDLAGYNTAWLSNQESGGVYASASSSVSLRSDFSKFSTKHDSNYNRKIKDDVLFGFLEDTKNSEKFIDKDKNNFYIFHLQGNHANYFNRYPKEFERFNKDDLTETIKNPDKRKRLSEYVNATLYNDYIVSEIFSRFANEDSLLIYLSDHGESIYEYKGIQGHGVVSRFTVEIPLIFMASDEFKLKHDEIWQKIKLAKDKPFMSDDLSHTLADILGVRPLEFEPARSLLRSEFNVNRKRTVQGVDYESIRNQRRFE